MDILYTRPKEDGFYMPAEFAPHEATVLIWPVRPGSWGKEPAKAQKAFLRIMQEAVKSETVYLLAAQDHINEARRAVEGVQGNAAEQMMKQTTEPSVSHKVILLEIESDDAWARDVAPTFVTNGEVVRGINWKFNAWGGDVDGLYASWDKDDAVAGKMLSKTGYGCYDASHFVLEGGSIHSDGEGTVMVTESCLLSKGRNPYLTRAQIEETLCDYLGAEKILWIPRGIFQDETNEHVDNVCAFIGPGEVVLAWTNNEKDPQYKLSNQCLQYLESQKDAKGRRLQIHKLLIPDVPVLVTEEELADYEFETGEDMREAEERLAASYVNFYFTNGAVIVPQFGGVNKDSDQRALKLLRELCPDREVVGIDSRVILLGGGNIHCITQQIPKGERG